MLINCVDLCSTVLRFWLLGGVLSLCAPGSHAYPRGCCCRAVRQAYLQNGGNDPDILAQLAQMQAEAQAIDDSMRNAQKRQPKGRLLDRKCIACRSVVAYQCYCGLSVWDWVIGKWGWELVFVHVCRFQRGRWNIVMCYICYSVQSQCCCTVRSF